MDARTGSPATARPAEPAAGAAPAGTLTLEIGGGHNPYPESDVIVDKFLENRERGGDLKMDRPVVKADFQQLPFRDGAFRYAICSHVLEHVEDPPAALAELARVAKAGYLETPSAVNEVVEPHREYHRWYVARKGRKLVFYPKKPGTLPQQALLGRLLTQNAAFKVFYLSNPDLASTRLEWRGRVEHEVMPASAPLDLESLYPEVGQSVPAMLMGLAGHYLGKLRRRSRAKARAGKPLADITGLLCCPVCKSSFRYEGERMICDRCGGYYRREGQLFHLLREDLVPF